MAKFVKNKHRNFKNEKDNDMCVVSVPQTKPQSESYKVGNQILENTNRLPSLIIFDVVPTKEKSEYVSIHNPYVSFINPLYDNGACPLNTVEEAMAMISSMPYIFQNRVRFLLMTAVNTVTYQVQDTFRDMHIYSNGLYEDIMNKIEDNFGDAIYRLSSYFGPEKIITLDSMKHLINSIDTLIYNAIIDRVGQNGLDKKIYDNTASISYIADGIIESCFTVVINEVEAIYGPQMLAVFGRINNFKAIETEEYPI